MTKIAKQTLRLTALTFGMFLFGFALVPLYDVFCEVTGLNGKVDLQQSERSLLVDTERQVTVQLITVANASMPWRFEALQQQVSFHPGEDVKAVFRVQNLTGMRMVGQAIPSVSPAEGARYLHKIQCFCFEQQVLEANETQDMVVFFTVDPKLPKDIHKLSLSYTLFDMTTANAVSSR